MEKSGGALSMSLSKQNSGRPRWFVKFQGGFQNQDEAIEAFAMLANFRGQQYKTILPTGSQIRNYKTDIVLLGDGMAITVKHGAMPRVITEKAVTFGVGPDLSDADLSFSLRKFPDLEVRIYKARGRPRQNVKRARVKGAREVEGDSWRKAGAKAKISRDAARHSQPHKRRD
jgi:hypothetical protein